MPMQSCLVDHILFVRWTATPQQEDLPQFDEAIREARAAVKDPVFHVALLSPGIEMPAMSLQRPLIRRALKLKSQCRSLHAVYEGTGVRDAIARRFLRGLVTMFGLKGKAFIHAKADEAVAQLQADLETPGPQVLEQLRAGGLVA